MSLTSDIPDWQHVMKLVKSAAETDQHDMLLTILMTADEREALIARVNIVNELLKGEISQRQISQMLGVGLATITRGSNELKAHSEQQRKVLFELLNSLENDNTLIK
ncbi:trp operon repressor [Vibrio sp. TH_r3]|uniref:trp operon repressor n=1 Tax=Vibrio sp. TH_r3 TaxID=3082084 RepID=UPI00295394CA|nr:trp operon repressor [Vibrio sp. TH_r3]MDV7105240.1 trp operon repressor [Vibrio sp. TH_r3]